MWQGRGSGEDGKDTVLRKRAGPWALACFVFKRERDGDRETEKQRFRDRRRDRERLRAEGEKETQRLRGTGAGEDPSPHTARERQGEAGRTKEKGQRGGSKAASPLRPVPHQELRPGAGWAGGGLPRASVPMSPHQVPARGRRPQRGLTEVPGVATGSLSPEGGQASVPTLAPARHRGSAASSPPFMVIVYAFAF